MDQRTAETTLIRTVMVRAPIEHAFRVFTEGMDKWWPREHHIGAVEPFEVVLESRSGGRWFERGVDGSECDWGRVLAYDPPAHVALSWHLDGDFVYDPDPDRASRVDVTFAATAAGTTRVDLVHSELDRHGDNWPRLLDGIASPNGWSATLKAYTSAVSATF